MIFIQVTLKCGSIWAQKGQVTQLADASGKSCPVLDSGYVITQALLSKSPGRVWITFQRSAAVDYAIYDEWELYLIICFFKVHWREMAWDYF